MESEFINQIKDEATQIGKTFGRVGKLHLIGIISRVLGLFLLILTLILCALALFSFAAVAAIDALATCMPVWAASLIIGSTFIVLIVVAIVCRKPLFVNPFIRLLSKQVIGSQEELDIETLKASHEAELQTMRVTAQVENVTREVDFVVSTVSRVWNFLRGLLRNRKS